MKYIITQKAVDDWIYDEVWEMEVLEAVDWFIGQLVLGWYLEPIVEISNFKA